MGRKRPATISSSPPDERGRVGSRSPPGPSHRHASKPLKARAQTASGNPASAGIGGAAAALPPILPGKRLLTPQRHAAPLEPRSPSKQQPQQRQQRPSAVSAPAGSPRRARQTGTTPPRGSGSRNVACGGGGAVVAVRAVPAPSTTPAAAAAAAAAAPPSEVAPHPRRPTRQPTTQQASSPSASPPRQQHPPYRRKPTTHNTAPKPAVVKPAVQPTTAVKEEEQEEEEPLTAEEMLLLCGVQPGTSKALWFTSMRSQLESRGGSGVDLYAAMDEGSSGTGASAPHSPLVSRSTGATPTPVVVSLVSSPLQVPEELLRFDSSRRADRRPKQPAASAAFPSSPIPRPPQRASPPSDPSSSPTVDDEEGSEDNVEDEDEHKGEADTAPLMQHREVSSSSVAHSEATSSDDGHYDNDAEDNDEVSASTKEEEEEEEEGKGESWERYASPSPRKVSSGTRRPMSEAANLLAQLRAAIEHRKSEVSLDGAAESQLHRLRPSLHQLQEFRVHVLSLEPGAEEM